MPLCEGKEHQRSLVLPSACKGPNDELFLIRFTGEVFDSYEDYLKALNNYRQRIWSCKYTGEAGLTYEEAATSEHRIDSVVSQFPSSIEEAAAKLLHHSLEPAESLATSLSKLGNGAVPVNLATQWMNAVALAEPVSGVPGVDCIWKLHEHFRIKYDLPEAPPPELAERLRPVRGQKQHLPAAAAGTAVHVEANGGAGEGSGLGDGAEDPAADADAEFEAEEAADAGDYDSHSDWEDDDYKPSRFSVDDLPWRARGRGRGRSRGGRGGRGGSAAGTGRGRGRGRGRWAKREEDELAVGADVGGGDAALAAAVGASNDDVDLVIETIEELEKRMQPGSIKHGVLTLLKEVGAAGMSINDLASGIMERGLKHWDEVKQARNSIASTCGHDNAFVRIAPGRFALRNMLPKDKLREMALPSSASRDHLGETAARQLAAVEAAQAEAMRKLNEQKTRGRVDRNNFKCPKCHRVAHTEGSPLVLCDTCPRSYHVACLGVEWSSLPTGDWCCPKCVETTQAALRRVMDLESRKKEALERAVTKEKQAEDKLLRRLLSKEEKDRRRSEPVAAAAAAAGVGSAMKDFSTGRQMRRALDDWEVLEEEKEHLARLEIRVKELQELAARGNGAGFGLAKEESFGPSRSASLTRGGSLATQPSLALSAYSVGEGEDAVTRAAEAAEALERLKLIIQGPPDEYPPLLEDAAASAAFAEAANVAEFLALYGAICEVDKDLTAVELVNAAAWPLDAAAELGPLYRQLLLCCLLEQMNRDPPVRGRSRRWFSVLTDATWPEVLRRYLLATKVNISSDAAAVPAEGEDEEDLDDADTEAGKSDRKKEFELLTAASIEPLEGIDPLAMDDRQFATHCAALLARGAWWELPAVLHLRLLGMLCYDIAQGQNLREDINARVQDCTKLQADLAKEAAAFRRHLKRAADGGSDGGGKRRRTSNAKRTSSAADDSMVDGENGDDDDTGTAAGGTNDDMPAVGAKEAQIELKLNERAYRTDPLGSDRHSRRYWWLRGAASHIVVESADGSPAGAICTQDQVDDLFAKLNRRGPKEQELYTNLRRKYEDIVASFAEEQTPSEAFNVYTLQRQVPTDGRIKQKDLPTLACMVVTAALTDAKEQLEMFITETQDIDMVLGIELKTLRKDLRAVETAEALCDFLLHLERYYCEAGEGLPLGAENDEIGVILGQDEAALLPEVVIPPSVIAAREAAEKAAAEEEAERAAIAAEKARIAAEKKAALKAAGKASEEEDEEMPDADNEEEEEEQKVSQQTEAVENEEGAGGTAEKGETEQEEEDDKATATTGGGTGGGRGTNATAAKAAANAASTAPVAVNDEFDDSDAEHAYLREKRMRRPARLWRSARERAVWLKTVVAAKWAAEKMQNQGAATQAAYCAHMLYDRGSKMLKVAAKLAEDMAKWEEQEAVRARAEAAAKGAEGSAGAGPAERPLMIRTGKFKSEEGTKVILKAMGKEPFPPGRLSTTDAGMVDDEAIAACRWGYQCSVCMLAGDLLCCEHPEGCAISVHPGCTGLPVPQGPWICSNHEDRRAKGRARRQRSLGHSLSALEDSDLDLTEDEETEAADSDVSEDMETLQGRRRSARR